MEKIKVANIEQVRQYTGKDGKQKFKYMVHQEHYNKDSKKYEGWECITVYSDVEHEAGNTIGYKWEYNSQYNNGRYIEVIGETVYLEDFI